MDVLIRFGLPLLFPVAFFGAAWYVAFRLRTAFGWSRRWLPRVLATALLIGSLVLMGRGTHSADTAAGLSYLLGGYVFAGYIFLTIALLLVHAIEKIWDVPKTRAGAAALLLAVCATLAGALRANEFSVRETEIELPGLKQQVVAMHLSDIHVGHHRGRHYLQGVGTFMARIRLGTSNELNVLRLRPER